MITKQQQQQQQLCAPLLKPHLSEIHTEKKYK
jgi:hypothetical protein